MTTADDSPQPVSENAADAGTTPTGKAADRGPIFHICRAEEWQAAEREGAYHGSSQDAADGFIHFSTAEQVVESAAKHRAGQEGLVLLSVDPVALGEGLLWEPSRGGQLFPHLYGSLALGAVLSVTPLPLGKDGLHRFPPPLGPEAWEEEPEEKKVKKKKKQAKKEAEAAAAEEPKDEPAANKAPKKSPKEKRPIGWKIAKPLLHRVDAERAHGLALRALKLGLVGGPGPITLAPLSQRLLGMDFGNPIGLAAGFDKNAEALEGLERLGFSFIEIGSVTPRPQPGNPRPRIFRLSEDHAIINRLGFNSEGAERVAKRLEAWRREHPRGSAPIVGVNLGKNKETQDAASDYAKGVRLLGRHADYLVINVSSPNTPGLRQLQDADALDDLARTVRKAKDDENLRCPILLKVAPDLDPAACEQIALVARSHFNGVIVSNSTLSRAPGLVSPLKKEAGGLSGRPLFDLSTAVLKRFRKLTQGKIVLIGLGGVEDAAGAYAKIRAGASLVQLYSAMIYAGPGLAASLIPAMVKLLERDGFGHISEAIGVDADRP